MSYKAVTTKDARWVESATLARRRHRHCLVVEEVPDGCTCHWQFFEVWRLVERMKGCPLHGDRRAA